MIDMLRRNCDLFTNPVLLSTASNTVGLIEIIIMLDQKIIIIKKNSLPILLLILILKIIPIKNTEMIIRNILPITKKSISMRILILSKFCVKKPT